MKKYLYKLLLVVLCFSGRAMAQAPVVFNGNNAVIGKNISIYEDVTGRQTVQQVEKSGKFIPSTMQTPNLNLSRSVFWLRFSITNKSELNNLILSLEYPTLNICDLYYKESGKFKVEELSDTVPIRKRKFKHQNFLFDIHLPTDSTATYYMQVSSSEPMVLPLVLSTPQHMAEKMLASNILWGIFIGLIAVMVLYNFFIYLFTKDKSYLYYVIYSSTIGLTQTTLSGYTYHYLFPNSPYLFHLAIIIFPAMAGISAMLFVRDFLHTKKNTPKLNNWFNAAIFTYSLAIVFRITGLDGISYRTIDFSALFTTALIYIVAVKISMQGYRPAKLFLIAWTIFFAGIILFTLRGLGILPYGSFTNYTVEAGIAFEVTLLSLALADRINILKMEKEQSQAESLERARENERIIREQNVILEVKVTERTSELFDTLQNLKQTQAQLVDAEKMASLGQLTAGIAHEINNPINFVTANVSPLRRDVEMLLDAMNSIEQIGLSDATVADKQQKIEDYKEELDFDYLKTEIKHLLNGIYDGASRTAEIVKGLRIFSRLDEDDLKLADLNEGMESCMIILNNLLNNRIEVVREYGQLPLVECYPGKLNQVFLNILSNAIYAVNKKFGENHGGKITISTSNNDGHVYIKMKDNGIGMDEKTIKKIFEPFFTTKEVGEGTGLGMSIAYNTIKKHNGEITVTSTPGEGSEFTIQLPVVYEVKHI